MRKKLLLFASLLFSYCYVQGQCNAYAGTMTLSNDGSGNIPRAVCFGSAVALENNGDYVLPPAAPGRQAGVMLGIFSCPPTSRNNINAGCWTGWYWTGESFVNSNTGEIQSSVGINEFWFAPIAADAAGANPNHDANNDGCYDIGIDQAQYFIFLDEIRVQNTTTAADRCQGRATLVISGGSPIFRTQPARSLGGLYNVVNSGGGTMNLSGAHNQNVEITGLSTGDLISIDITDPNGCTTSYTFNFIGAPQPAFTFNDFCAGSNNNRPTGATPAGGRYSFSPAPTDGAAINPITGVITNGVPGTTYYVVYTTTGSCQVSTPPQAVMVLPRSPTPIIPADQRNFEVCLGESAILTPGGGSNFRLYNNPNYTGLRATGSSFNLAQFGTPGQLTAFYVTSIDGCESEPVLVTITINVPVSPVVNPLVYNLCRGEEVTITPTSTVGVTEFEYYSNAALTNQLGIGSSFTFIPNNTMQVFIVQYVNGCRSNPVSVSIVVSLPPNRPTVNTPAPICVGTAIPTLNATGVSGTVQVQWFTTNPTTGNPTPVFTGTSFTPAINNNTAGIYNYWVRIRNTATGCIGEAAMTTISIFDTPPAPVVTIDSVVICTGGSIPTFTASGVGGTLRWYNTDPSVGNPAPIATGTLFNPTVNNATPANLTYWVLEAIGTGNCVGPARRVRLSILPQTARPIATPDSLRICTNAAAPVLSAISSNGSIRWYDMDPNTAGAMPIANGNTFIPSLNTTAPNTFQYWAIAISDTTCQSTSTRIRLFVDAPPATPTVDNARQICTGETIPAFAANGTGGTLNWYNANPGTGNPAPIHTGTNLTPNIDNSTAGIFNLWVTETNTTGCVSAAAITSLTINARPAAPVVAAPAAICTGEVIPTLNVTGLSIRWYNTNPTTGNPTPIATGNNFTPMLNNNISGTFTYWATAINATGCEGTAASVNLTINARPGAPVAANPTPICAGETLPSLSANTNTAALNWYNTNPTTGTATPIGSGAVFVPNLNNTPPGDYNFWVTATSADGCEGVATLLTVRINAVPNVPQAISPQQICLGETIPSLTANGAGGIIRWYDSDPTTGNPSSIATGNTFTPLVSNNNAGNFTYWITETNATGCQSAPDITTLTINDQLDAPAVITPAPICVDEDIPTLSATSTGGTLQWYNSNPATGNPMVIATGEAFTPNIANNVPGNFDFWVTETSLSGCVGLPALLTIRINNQPNTPQAIDPAPICANDPLPAFTAVKGDGVLNWYNANPATGSATFLGSGDFFTPAIDNTLAGNYTFWVQENNGCIGDATSLTLIINTLPEAPQANPPIPICAGQAIPTLSSSASGVINWYDENPTNSTSNSIATGLSFTPGLDNMVVGDFSFWITQTDGNGCVSAPTSITLTINALPQAPQASDPAAICAEQAIPTLSTAAPGTVRWYDANPALGNPSSIGMGATFTPNLNNALAGNYTFWLNQTDGNGCVSAPTSITLTINALPVLNVSNTIDPGCNLSNGSIAVNATGDGAPFNYQLNNGPLNGTGIFSNLDAGNYTIRVQDSRGCTDAITTLLVAPNGVVAIAGENRQLTCLTPNLTLDGSASTGPNGFSYEWTRDGAVISTAPAFNVSEGGTYILTVAFEGCINRDTVVITNNIRDIVATINPSATQLTCAVNNILLDGSASTNGANMQYEWQHNNTAISGAIASRFDATLPGTYRLIVTDNSNGCTNAATFDIVENRQLPQVNAGADQLLNCNMPTANLSGTATANGPLAYAWLNSSGAVLSNTNTLQANVPGAYVLRVTNMENSCVNEDQVQINSDFDYPVANAGNGGQLDCVVTELSLGGTGTSTGSNFSLSWRVLRSNAPAPQPIATPVVSNPGLYVLTVINNRNGCTTSDSVLVTQVLPDNLNFQVLVTPPSCTGRNNDARIRIIPQDNTATFVYRIGRNTPFSSQNAFTEVRAGTYLLVAQDIYGCEWDTTITIEPITPVQVNLGGNRIVRLGEDVQLEAMLNLPSNMIRSVQWLNPERLSCADCLTPRIEALMEPMTPAIFVTDVNGCTAQASINIFINKERRVFVPTAFSPNGDGSNDRLVFFGGPDVRSVKSMQIFTRWGEKVFEMRDFQPNDPEYGWDGTFRGAGNRTLNPGVFVYVAEVEFIDGEVEIFKGDVTLIK